MPGKRLVDLMDNWGQSTFFCLQELSYFSYADPNYSEKGKGARLDLFPRAGTLKNIRTWPL